MRYLGMMVKIQLILLGKGDNDNHFTGLSFHYFNINTILTQKYLSTNGNLTNKA